MAKHVNAATRIAASSGREREELLNELDALKGKYGQEVRRCSQESPKSRIWWAEGLLNRLYDRSAMRLLEEGHINVLTMSVCVWYILSIFPLLI